MSTMVLIHQINDGGLFNATVPPDDPSESKGVFVFEKAPTGGLMLVGDMKKRSYQVDRISLFLPLTRPLTIGLKSYSGTHKIIGQSGKTVTVNEPFIMHAGQAIAITAAVSGGVGVAEIIWRWL